MRWEREGFGDGAAVEKKRGVNGRRGRFARKKNRGIEDIVASVLCGVCRSGWPGIRGRVRGVV
jgi:hypothetical protein